MTARHLIAAVLVATLVSSLSAQVVLTSDPVASTGYGVKNCVRNAAGDLYCLVIQEQPNGDQPLLLQVSTNGGDELESGRLHVRRRDLRPHPTESDEHLRHDHR